MTGDSMSEFGVALEKTSTFGEELNRIEKVVSLMVATTFYRVFASGWRVRCSGEAGK
jgi:hypothetical protein